MRWEHADAADAAGLHIGDFCNRAGITGLLTVAGQSGVGLAVAPGPR